jgi:hypothetical protein
MVRMSKATKIIPIRETATDAAADIKHPERDEACDQREARPFPPSKRNRRATGFAQADLERACRTVAKFGPCWRVTLTTADGSKVTVESGSYAAPGNAEGDTSALDRWMAKHARDA